MIRLFSSFDLILFYTRRIIFIFFPLFIFNFTFRKTSNYNFIIIIFYKLEEFFFRLKDKSFNKIRVSIPLVFIFRIMTFNLFSIFPYNFPWTSQFGVVLEFSLILWFRFIIFNLISNMKGFISHLVPEGTPIYLTMLLFLIELVRNFIRPLTLTVRLVANILAGHLLIILLSKIVLFNLRFLPFYILLNTVEIFVALIQSYIFTTIIVLYFSEVH